MDNIKEAKPLDPDLVFAQASVNLDRREMLENVQKRGMLLLPVSFQDTTHIKCAIGILQSFIDFIEAEE